MQKINLQMHIFHLISYRILILWQKGGQDYVVNIGADYEAITWAKVDQAINALDVTPFLQMITMAFISLV